MEGISKGLIIAGILLIVVGLLWQYVGRLPGDIVIKREHMTLYIPIGTCVAVSIVLSLLLYIIGKFR